MKRWKKIALVLVGLLVLSQAPFVYRRYRLGRLRAAIDSVNASRAPASADDPFVDYKGVLHVHSSLGGHSTGTLDEIVQAARANDLAFVVMTEHPSKYVDTAAATLKGTHEGVLFVNGSELSAANDERLFVVPGPSAPGAGPAAPDAQALVERARAEGRLALVAYPEKIRDWGLLQGFDGIEVYNLYTNSKRIRPGLLFFDGLWSYRSHADLLFSTFYERPDENLRRWDELCAARGLRLTAVAGNDAHSNVGLRLGDRTGKEFLGVRLDPYERSFSVVRNHVLLERVQPLAAGSLAAALRHGRSYIAFDIFGDSTGFRFTAHSPVETKTMGDEIALPAGGEVRLKIRTPAAARVVFFRDGQVIRELEAGTDAELAVGERGVYRVEVYLAGLRDFLGERKPWIISNPIYVR